LIRVTLRSGGQGVTIFYGGETTNAPGLAEVRLGWPPSSEALYGSLRPLLRTDMILTELIGKTSVLTAASKYTALNGVVYLLAGTLLVVWPGVVQTLFRDPAFVGHEGALMRVIGLTTVVIGWLYLFGGRSGARQIVAASVIDRLVFVPLVLLPLAAADIFPHLLVTFTILDMSLALGAWTLLRRE